MTHRIRAGSTTYTSCVLGPAEVGCNKWVSNDSVDDGDGMEQWCSLAEDAEDVIWAFHAYIRLKCCLVAGYLHLTLSRVLPLISWYPYHYLQPVPPSLCPLPWKLWKPESDSRDFRQTPGKRQKGETQPSTAALPVFSGITQSLNLTVELGTLDSGAKDGKTFTKQDSMQCNITSPFSCLCPCDTHLTPVFSPAFFRGKGVEAQRGWGWLPRLCAKEHASNSKPVFFPLDLAASLQAPNEQVSSHIWMWELDHKEGRVLKNWCFWTVVLEKTLESPLDCKEIKPVSPKGNWPWISIGRNDAEAEAPKLWPPDVKSRLTGKDPVAQKDGGQEEEGTTEDEMVGRHHWLNRYKSEQTQGTSKGQGSLVCCSPWGCKELATEHHHHLIYNLQGM